MNDGEDEHFYAYDEVLLKREIHFDFNVTFDS